MFKHSNINLFLSIFNLVAFLICVKFFMDNPIGTRYGVYLIAIIGLIFLIKSWEYYQKYLYNEKGTSKRIKLLNLI